MDETSFSAACWQEEFGSSVMRHYNNNNNIEGQKDSVDVVQESEDLLLECMWGDFFASNDSPALEAHMISKSSDLLLECMWGDFFASNDSPAPEAHMISKSSEESLSSLDNIDGIKEPLYWIGNCLAPTNFIHDTKQLSFISLSTTTTSTIKASSPSSSSSSFGNEKSSMEDSPILRYDHPSSRECDNEDGGEGSQSDVIASSTRASCMSIGVRSSQKASSFSSLSNASITIEPYNGNCALPSIKGLDNAHTKINHGDITKTNNIKLKFIPVTSTTSSVAYPFTVLKPSGVQGDITLDDINQRISTKMAPIINMPNASHSPFSHGIEVLEETLLPLKEHQNQAERQYKRIKRHYSPIVLRRTKIHTEGKGSITIIRTKNKQQFACLH